MKKLEQLKWSHHELSDNFGMTLEQSKKVNDLITLAHNNAIDKCRIFIENEIRSKFIKESTIGQNSINVFNEIMINL